MVEIKDKAQSVSSFGAFRALIGTITSAVS
jgi:hypothetical protein